MIDTIEDRFPYQCKTIHPQTEVVPWCEQHFGEFGTGWFRYGTDIAMGITTNAYYYDYYRFAHSEDAVLFALRWA